MADPTPSSSVTAPPPMIAQPNHFYCNAELHPNTAQNLTPEEDPVAARGIPVFKPTWQEFSDFEKYMEAIQPWGIRSGIVKVIPPVEWRNGLPDMRPFLEDIKIRHPIEQNMLGISGIFRQQNIEKRRVYSLREWFEVGMSQDFRSPGREEVYRDRSKTQIRKGRASKGVDDSQKASEVPVPRNQLIEQRKSSIQEAKSSKTAGGLEVGADRHSSLSAPTHPAAVREDIDIEGGEMDDEEGQPPVDTNILDVNAEAARLAKEQKALFAKERKAARAALRSDLDSSFISTFDPTNSWVPPGSSAEDFSSPEFAAAIERAYWRSCGVGKPAMYGADLPGSLFCDISRPEQPGKLYRGIKGMEGPIPWDVSRLPSALTRLLPRGMKLPGVNTPYLYFGMWRATFAWHVEDMDLYSINYIHWGAPKHWYAVPQARAKALEGVMRQMFPSDRNGCPQFLRHKSYLASPTALKNASIKPNTLVQSAGEFVVTYPRGYHAGFNMGLNCAESVNFALESWLELGRKAAFCRCVSDSVRIDVDALLAEKTRIAAEEEAGLRRPTVEPRLAKVHPAPPPQALGAPSQPPKPRKRKISETSASPAKANPVTIKRAKREVSADILPCCLCVSPATEGLLPVNDPPFAIMGVAAPVTKEGTVRWMAHETCASIIPETWVDEVDGQKKVFGVDTIAKDRWLLRCAACSSPDYKAHGAPIQCTKGKCSKAFHVSCAQEGKAGTYYKVVEEQEQQVLLNLNAVSAPQTSSQPEGDAELVSLSGTAADPPTHQVLKTIKKLNVEVNCSQHNSDRAMARRQTMFDNTLRSLLTIPPHSRIRIKLPNGCYECTLVSIDPKSETIEVIWSNGGTKRCKWSAIVSNSSGPLFTAVNPASANGYLPLSILPAGTNNN